MNERIKSIRKEFDLTQQQFADRLGVARNNIAGYETGKRCPSDAVISLICREFNIDESWLRKGEGKMFVEVPESDQLSNAVAELMKGVSPEDKKVQQLLINYFQMSQDSKKLLFDLVEKLFNGVSESEKKVGPIDWSDVPATPEELERRYPPVDIDEKKEIGYPFSGASSLPYRVVIITGLIVSRQ